MAGDMDSTIDTLKSLLDSPGAAEKLESLLGAFAGEGGADAAAEVLGSAFGHGEKKDDNPFGDIPMESIMKIAKAYKSVNKTNDPRVTLLKAIKPYVRKERSESVDTAIKLLGLLQLAPLLGDMKDIL